MARSQKTTFIAMHYDKLIVVVVLLALLFSLGFLISLSRSQGRAEVLFNARLEALSPESPEAKALGSELFEATELAIEEAALVHATGLLIAAERVACIQCGLPIKSDVEICPYCNTQQPTGGVGEDWDSDKDGMPDVWELEYGLNPLDPGDASGDLDKDGFTNLEEYLAGTDPTDPKSRPPLIDFLRVEKIDAIRFPYVLKSKMRSGANTYKFQINEGTRQTFYIQLGDEIAKSGYKAISFTNRLTKVVTPGIGESMRSLTVLTVSNGEDDVELVERGKEVWHSFKVTLICEKTPRADPIIVNRRDSFTFDGERYTVDRIAKRRDSGGGEIVILHESTDKEITIPSL